MRVDKGTEVLAIDNMQRRAIKGTTGLGFLLSGAGRVWLNSTKLEIVGADVPTTKMNVTRYSANSKFNGLLGSFFSNSG
jgi:hypothetical protein